MGIWDSLFGSKKGPARGRTSAGDDDADAGANYTRAIRRDELERHPAPSDDWDPQPAARSAPPPPEERSAPPIHSPPRRAAPPPLPPAHEARAVAPPAPERSADDDEPPPTEYARVARPALLKVAALLLGVDGPLESHVIRIYQGENILGREAEPEAKDSVPSSAASISRKHARLTADGGFFMLEPVQLKNATLVGGMPIDSHAPLQHGDRITLGTTKPCSFVLLVVPA